MGSTTTQTCTRSHSSATHAHTSSHSAVFSDNNPLCGVAALSPILNPPAFDKENVFDYVRDEKLPDEILSQETFLPDKLLMSFQLNQLHNFSS